MRLVQQSGTETVRLLEQDRLFTQAMGGVLCIVFRHQERQVYLTWQPSKQANIFFGLYFV
jgi:hypothetical protein